MQIHWKKLTLGDLGQIITGKTPSTQNSLFWDGNIPFITPKDIQSSKHILTTERYLSQDGAHAVKSSILPKDSICVSCIGNIGYIGKTTKLSVSNQQINSIIPNQYNDSDFIYYLMKSLWVYFKNYEGQSTALSILNKSQFSNIEISIPPLDVQKKIAGVLGALDDKIELNNKINQNLEAQAQALFKSWFIDFEPFGGKMPNDWEEKQLFEVSQMYAGGDKPKVISEKKTEQCSIPIYSNGISDNGLYGWTNEACIFEESVTVSARGTIGFVCLRLEPFFPIVRLISLLPNTELLSAKYLYFALCNEKISGTGTTQEQLTIPYFRTTKILLPSKDIMNKFTRIADAFYALIKKNKQGNAHLSKLRDTLLPKLMNGEIDVDNVKID